MINFFLPFLIGYGVARLTSYMLDASQERSYSRETILLKWDNGSFGWRPNSPADSITHDSRYMLGTPLDYETANFINTAEK